MLYGGCYIYVLVASFLWSVYINIVLSYICIDYEGFVAK